MGVGNAFPGGVKRREEDNMRLRLPDESLSSRHDLDTSNARYKTIFQRVLVLQLVAAALYRLGKCPQCSYRAAVATRVGSDFAT